MSDINLVDVRYKPFDASQWPLTLRAYWVQ